MRRPPAVSGLVRRAARRLPQGVSREQSARGTWSVVTTVRAPRWMVDEFVRYFAAAGAREIFLFFDDPALKGYTPHERVRATVCNSAYWRGQRPAVIEERQYRNHARARRRSEAAWLLHVDIDERVHASRRIDRVLADVPDDVFSVLAPSREAVYADPPTRSTLFRTRWFKNAHRAEPGLVRDLYGDDLVPFGRRGVWGHITGKTFVRNGSRIGRRSLHRPVPADPAAPADRRADDLVLLHYEGMTFDLFREKLTSRSSGGVVLEFAQGRFEARRAYAWEVYQAGGEAALFALYRRLHVLEPDALARALGEGFVEERDVDRFLYGPAARLRRALRRRAARLRRLVRRVVRRPQG